MAIPLGFKDFVTGEVLTADDVDGYLMQGLWTFATAAARDAAVTAPQEGNACYLKDIDVIQVYNGSSWATQSASNPISANILDAKGDLIAATADNTPARLAVGTDGQVLTADSTAATGLAYTTPTVSASGLNLISTITLTASSSFNITGCFSATYDDYLIQIDNIVGSTASFLTYGFRTSSTNSTTNYKKAVLQFTYANSNGSNGNTNTGHLGSMDFLSTNANCAGASVIVNGPFLTKGTNCFVSMNSDAYAVVSAGLHADATSYESLWFIINAGTVTGSIKIYGMAK